MATFTKLPSGNWRAQIRQAGHRPIGKTFPRKAEAKDWAERIEGNRDAIDSFPDAEARRRTVSDAIEGRIPWARHRFDIPSFVVERAIW